ncbi:MAG: glycosyltransferase family 4 protein [Planctomycetaceae bacterium]|nr:glycosyltransferase family 4 protein [Planctomycetaceae bacterium]
MHRPIVLCFVDYYLPGFRAGGPTRTIANLVDMLGDEFDIRIVTRDRDFGDTKPYEGMKIDGWNQVGKAKVFYASAATLSLKGLRKVIRETEHDAVYLNSFLSPKMTGLPLLLRRLKQVPAKPWILAPRGEFAPAALAAKALKKRIYLLASRAAGLYDGLTWQASAPHEAQDIRSVLGSLAKRVFIAPDLPRAPSEAVQDRLPIASRRPERPLRLVFLSRLAPVKNLDFLLDVLSTVRREVELTIHGLQENAKYWQQCEAKLAALPANVRASYEGAVMPEDVPHAFSKHDLFVFPSRGENFGHVVLESLSAGTPVLVSDRTPWQGGESDALEVLSLDKPEAWRDAIERWSSLDTSERSIRRDDALDFAYDYIEHRAGIEECRQLFLDAMGLSAEATPAVRTRGRRATMSVGRRAARPAAKVAARPAEHSDAWSDAAIAARSVA